MSEKINIEGSEMPPKTKIDLTRSETYLHDNTEFLQFLPPNSIDCSITDEPYGINFMGKGWDRLPTADQWKELLRVLKPGAWNLVICSPRQDVMGETINRLKEAGFNVGFSSIYWTYAEGAAKVQSLEKRLGDEYHGCYPGMPLKPAVEVVLVTMKPLSEDAYYKQAEQNRKGMVHVGPTRIPWREGETPSVGGRHFHSMTFGGQKEGGWKPRNTRETKKVAYGKTSLFRSATYNDNPTEDAGEYEINPDGRFPANLLVSNEILGDFSRFYDLSAWFERELHRLPPDIRKQFPFLYVRKPTRKEKQKHGLNNHETVKPLELMVYLIQLTTDPGDIVLDIFNGSGTTTVAAKMCDRIGIGCEAHSGYHAIAASRMHKTRIHKRLDGFL